MGLTFQQPRLWAPFRLGVPFGGLGCGLIRFLENNCLRKVAPSIGGGIHLADLKNFVQLADSLPNQGCAFSASQAAFVS